MDQSQQISRYESYCQQLADITFEEWESLTEVGFHGLDIGDLDLSILPDSIEHVVFKNCIIPKVTTSIKLKHLTRLTIQQSKLEIFNIKKFLPKLSFLNLKGNLLETIRVPDGEIFTLDLSDNKLRRIKMNHQRRQMMTFDVGGNPDLTSIPPLNTYVSVLGVKNNKYIHPDMDVMVDLII